MRVLPASIVTRVRHRPVVTTCFALTALLAPVNYYLWGDREALVGQHAEARRNGEFMLHALNGRARIDADNTALRDALGQIDGNLLDERGMEMNLGYFYRIERTTKAHLVRLNQLASLPPSANTRFKTVPFSMQLTGSYRTCMSFLRALETGPRIVRIRNCNFERSSDNNNTDLTLDLTVDVLAKK